MSRIISDNNAQQQLPAGLDYKRLSHAYIAGSSEDDLLVNLATAAVCTGFDTKPCMTCRHCDKALRGIHPDIQSVDLLPDKREITVEQIRNLKQDAIVMPNEAEKKVYIIRHADAMNTAAQNALLLLLEEPPKHVMIILSASNPAALLRTVRSRCVELKGVLSAATKDPSSDQSLVEEFFTALDKSALELTEFSFRLDRLDRIALTVFINSAIEEISQKARELAQARDSERLERLLRAEQALKRASEYSALNVSAVHISGFLCANLI